MKSTGWLLFVQAGLMLSCSRIATNEGVADCADYASLAMCSASLPSTLEQREDAIDAIDEGCHAKLDEASERGDSCHAAYLDALACLADLNCDEFGVWMTHDSSSLCFQTWARVEQACGDLPLEPNLGVPG